MKRSVFIGSAVLALSACGGGGSGSNNTPPVNVAPNATGLSLTLSEDNSISIVLSGTDSDGSISQYEIMSQTENGTLSGSVPNLEYTPHKNYFGSDAFTFRVIDNDGAASEVATVSLDVSPVNDAPVVQTTDIATVLENTTATSINLASLVTDVDSDDVSIELVAQADSPLFTIEGEVSALRFINPPDFEAPASESGNNLYRVIFNAVDGEGAVTQGVANVEVTDESQISISIHYPTDGANLGGNATSVTVSGTVADDEDGEVLATDVSSINTNDIAAVVDLAAGTWTSTLPVASTDVELVAEVSVDDSVVAQTAVSVTNSALLYTLESPLGGVVDEANNRIIAVDASLNAVVEIDLATGEITEISGPSVGSGVPFVVPRSVAYDSVRDVIFVTDTTVDAVIKVNVETGAREIFIEESLLNPSDYFTPNDITYDHNSDALYLTANYDTILEKVNPQTGARIVVTGGGTGSGDTISNIDAVAVDSVNNVAYVTERYAEKIFRADLATGERTLIAFGSADSGETFSDIVNIAISNSGNTLFFVGRTSDAELKPAVYAFNLVTNHISLINSVDNATASNIGSLQDIILGDDDQTYWLLDSRAETVFEVNMATEVTTSLSPQDETTVLTEPTSALWDSVRARWFIADRTQIYVAERGEGAPLLAPFSVSEFTDIEAVEFNEKTNRLFAVDRLSRTRKVIVEVDTTTGVSSVVMDSEVIGSDFYTNQLVFDDENNILYWTDYRYDEVAGFNLTTARPFTVANSSIGSGANLSFATTTVGDLANGRLFVYDNAMKGIFSVDISTGDRVEIASVTKGSGVEFEDVYSMTYDDEKERLFIADSKHDLLITVDVATGDREVLSQPNGTIPLYGASGMSFDSETNNIFVADFNKESVYVIDAISGERAILTR